MGSMRRPKRPATPKRNAAPPSGGRRWAVYRIGKPQKFVGFISDAPDEATARRLAIDAYQVPENWRGHLIAYRE
jgi:hypothetical protein